MRSCCFFLLHLAVTVLGVVLIAGAQTARTSDIATADVELNTVFLPVYPPLAKQARIMGDVKVELKIRQDGSVVSAEVVSGHPMLKQAVLESAKKSTFLCQGCTQPVTLFILTYTFGMRDDYDGFDLCSGNVWARSAKCFYLWKCGWSAAPWRKPAVGHTRDHVLVLGDGTCVETETSR